MSENEQGIAEDDKQLLLQKIYVKDISFESPRAPDCFGENLTPQTQLNLKSNTRQPGLRP